MSTRCNVIIRTPDGAKVYLYRHCDGYPSGEGDTIASVWLSLTATHYDANQQHDPYWKAKWIKTFLPQLMQTTGSGGDPHHEFTSGLHGDIEFLYIIDLGGFVDYGQPIAEPMIRVGCGYKITEEETEKTEPFPISELSAWIWRYEAAREREEESSEDAASTPSSEGPAQ